MEDESVGNFVLSPAQFEELAEMLQQGCDFDGYEECCEQLQKLKSSLAPLHLLQPIIQESTNLCSRMLILTIFKEIIAVIWDTISPEQQEFLQHFFFDSVSTTVFCPDNSPESSSHIICLIEILKKIWPEQWPEFTRIILQRAKSESGAPINVTKFFLFLFQEIKETVQFGITLSRHVDLEKALDSDTPFIAAYISDIFAEVQDTDLIQAGLETLATMLRHVDPVLFQSQAFLDSITNIFGNDLLKADVLNCFAQIPSSKIQTPSIGRAIEVSYNFLLHLLQEWLQEGFDFHYLCEENDMLAHSLTLALVEFLQFDNFRFLETSLTNSPQVLAPIKYMVSLFGYSNGPAYELCLEFWEQVTQKICFDPSEMPVPEDILSPLIHILSERIVPPPDFPFDETERGENEYSSCASIFDKLAKLMPEEAATVTKNAILLHHGLKLFCDSFAFASIAIALPDPIEKEVAEEVFKFLLEKAEESQEHAISLIIVSCDHVKFLSREPGLLSTLIRLEIEWASSSSSESPVFQTFFTNAIDKLFSSIPMDSLRNGAIEVIRIASDFAQMVTPECHPAFFHGLASVLKAIPQESKATFHKDELMQQAFQFPIQHWHDICGTLEHCEPFDFANSTHIIQRIIEVNDPDMHQFLVDLINGAVQIFAQIPVDDQQHNHSLREIFYSLFETVIKQCEPELAAEVVSAIVEDYTSNPVESRFAEALACFAHFVRRGVNPELTLHLSSEVITSTAENLIEYGNEIPTVEVGIFELISAVVSCANKLEEFDHVIIEPLEQVIEWGLTRNSDTTVNAAISCITMVVSSPDTAFSVAFLDHYFIELIGTMIGAMMCPMDNLLFNSFCHAIQKMIFLQKTLEIEPDQFIDSMLERVMGFGCTEAEQPTIREILSNIVYEVDNFSKIQMSLSELISELRTAAFRNSSQREQFHLEGGFMLSPPNVVDDSLEEF